MCWLEKANPQQYRPWHVDLVTHVHTSRNSICLERSHMYACSLLERLRFWTNSFRLWTCLPWMGEVLHQPRYSDWSACHTPCPNVWTSLCKGAIHRQSTEGAGFQRWREAHYLWLLCVYSETSFLHKFSACLAWSANPRVHWKGGKGHQQTACSSCAPSVTLSMLFK